MGNPTSDGTWSYTWEHGRQLASMTRGSTTWNYTYDANGMRTGRSSSTANYTYVYNGGQLSKMTYSGLGNVTMYFTYDASGRPAVVTYNDVPYYYVTNLQGDVVAILNSTGTAVVQYTYDAWGKQLTTAGSMKNTLGLQNPLRYRGYVYDTELGLYYLQSRYYNPTLGRFLNADALVSTGQGVLGNNMFAYCLNNPVCRRDITGAYSVQTNAVCLEEETGSAGKEEWKSRTNKPKGSDKRGPKGKRERNVKHPNGEEHSIKPKGNGMPIRRCIGDSYEIDDYYQELPGTSQSYDIWITDSNYNGGIAIDLTPSMSTYETAVMVCCVVFAAAAVKMFWETVSWNQDMFNGN